MLFLADAEFIIPSGSLLEKVKNHLAGAWVLVACEHSTDSCGRYIPS